MCARVSFPLITLHALFVGRTSFRSLLLLTLEVPLENVRYVDQEQEKLIKHSSAG